MPSWDELNPMSLVGINPGAPQAPDVTTGQLSQTAVAVTKSGLHPDNALLWFGGILAVTLGLIGASAHLRVGPFRVGGDAGDPD